MGASRRSRARWKWRRTGLALVLLTVLGAVPAPALAGPEDDLEAAQERANRAAGELAEAEEEIARAQDAVAHLQTRVNSIDARVGATREQVRDLAIRLYVEGTVPIVRILRIGDANDVILAQQYSRVVAGRSTDSLQQFRADREDLSREQEALEEEQAAHAASVEELRERRAETMEEIDRLSEVVARVEAGRRAEAEAREAAAARPSGSAGSSSASDGPVAGSSSPGGQGSPAEGSPSSASVAPEEPTAGAAAGWICPVQGPHAFSNDYGDPRGGGSSHEGNDILAARGTPVVASVDGEVRHRSGAVSGLAYYLDGDDGVEYFGAHLDSFGESGRVSAGTVVGYVGNTGDAASTAPHLHFEMHPGGNGNINPYVTLTQYC